MYKTSFRHFDVFNNMSMWFIPLVIVIILAKAVKP